MAEESEDEQLKLAIALSLQDQKDSTTSVAPGGAPKSSILGLDRRTMEAERLARKRKAEEPSPDEPAAKSPKRSGPPIDVPDLEDTQTFTHPTVKRPPSILFEPVSSPLPTSTQAGSTSSPDLQHPNGVVLKTWAYGYARSRDIKIEEVLQRNTLSSAVLSSFQWDVPWVLSKLRVGATKLIFVMQAKDQETRERWREDSADIENLRLCFPPMPPMVNCMHSKLMLLFYPTHMRVVVPSANLVPWDWGEDGRLENSVFLVDLPRFEGERKVTSSEMTDFGRELVWFCEKMGLPGSLIRSLAKFDYRTTEGMAFVHTVGGVHEGADAMRTGYTGLGRAVERSGLKTEGELCIDFIASSIGSINSGFLAMLYLAAQGDDGTREYVWRSTAQARDKTSKAQAMANKPLRDAVEDAAMSNFRVLYPSNATVMASKGGPNAAGVIWMASKWWRHSPVFPKQAFYDCISSRDGMLMHNKLMYVRPKDPAKGFGSAWAYHGSANCSESAWGKLYQDKASKAPRLNCRNWECGVLMPMKRVDTLPLRSPQDARDGHELKAFEAIVPVPIKTTMQKLNDARRPWFNPDTES